MSMVKSYWNDMPMPLDEWTKKEFDMGGMDYSKYSDWMIQLKELLGTSGRFQSPFKCTQCDSGVLRIDLARRSKDNYCSCAEGNMLRDKVNKQIGG